MASSKQSSAGTYNARGIPSRISMIDTPARVTHRRMFPTHMQSKKPPWATYSTENSSSNSSALQHLENASSQQNPQVDAYTQTSLISNSTCSKQLDLKSVAVGSSELTSTESCLEKIGHTSTEPRATLRCGTSQTNESTPEMKLTDSKVGNGSAIRTTQYSGAVTLMSQSPKKIIRTEPRYCLSNQRSRVRSLKDRPPFYPPGPQPWQEINSYLSPNRLERIRQSREYYGRTSIRPSSLQNCGKSASANNLYRSDTYTQDVGQDFTDNPVSLKAKSSINLSRTDRTNKTNAVPLISLKTHRPSDSTPTKRMTHKSVSLRNLSNFSSVDHSTSLESRFKPFWSTFNVSELNSSSRKDSGCSTPHRMSILRPSTLRTSVGYDYTKPLKRTAFSEVNVSRESRNSWLTRPSSNLDNSWGSTYRLSRLKLEELKRDLLELNARANTVHSIGQIDHQTFANPSVSLFNKQDIRETIPSNPHPTINKPAQRFLVIKSIELIDSRKPHQRFISIVNFDNSLYVRLSSTQSGSNAHIQTTGIAQPLNLIHARIIYDLTYRSANRIPWWWQEKGATVDATKVIGAQVTTPRKARNKSKKNKPNASVSDIRGFIEGAQQQNNSENRPSRSQSRRRRLFEAVAASVDLRRSRSRSKGRNKSTTLEISGPIIQPRVVSEVFGQSPILYPPEGMNARTSAQLRDSQVPSEVAMRSSLLRTSSVERQQKSQSWDSSWDTTITNDGRRSQDPLRHPPPPPTPATQPFKPLENPKDKTILDILQENEQRNERFCDVCFKEVKIEDRYHLIGRTLHRQCFTCSRCTAPLANQSAVCQNGTWSCAHHVQYQLNSIDPPTFEQ